MSRFLRMTWVVLSWIPLVGFASSASEHPVLNPHATHFLTLTGILPNTLHIEFLLNYTTAARATSAAVGDEDPCGSMLEDEVFRPFDVIEPLRVARHANSFRATVTLDKYLPGHCGWHLELIGFTVADGVGALAESWFARVYDAKRDASYLGDLYEGRIDEWCRKNPYPADPRRPEQCASFPALQSVSPLPPELIERVPVAQRDETPLFWIFPRTENIRIDFHDLDETSNSSQVHP